MKPALPLLLLLVALAAQPAAPEAVVRVGMSAKEVRAALGPPQEVSRQILLYRSLEQWHYAQPRRRLQFDCPRGSPPVLTSIDTPAR